MQCTVEHLAPVMKLPECASSACSYKQYSSNTLLMKDHPTQITFVETNLQLGLVSEQDWNRISCEDRPLIDIIEENHLDATTKSAI